MQVSINGLITFGGGNNAFMPHQCPMGFTGIAIFFCDVAPVCGSDGVTGNVFYRITHGMKCSAYNTIDVLARLTLPGIAEVIVDVNSKSLPKPYTFSQLKNVHHPSCRH